MADFGLTRVEQGQSKIRSVPIAVTPKGFWCCPSPVGFQKTLKAQNPQTKPKHAPPPPKPPVQKKPTFLTETDLASNPLTMTFVSDDQRSSFSDNAGCNPSMVTERALKPNVENLQRKLAIAFGEPGTRDLKVVISEKLGFSVKMSVHKYVLVENSSFFAEKLSEQQSPLRRLEIDDCEDVESYVEVVGLMYCTEVKQRLIKQSVSWVLRILKVAELLGFNSCIQSCLEHLEAVPWVGEEEEKVVSSVLHLQGDSMGVTPVLKRVTSDVSNPPTDTLLHMVELVLKSNEERGRREMKSLVLGLLRENNQHSVDDSSHDICNENLYNLCRNCLDALLHLFRPAAEPGFTDKSMDSKCPVAKQISLEADNLQWLLEILSDRRAADEFVLMWASQQELATLHSRLPTVSRHLVSCITASLFIGIGRGEILPSKDTRLLLLQTWLQPLIDDYSWLLYGCRSFDRKVVEEGLGRTILTLPLDDQQSILLAWLGTFLKVGDNCPNLHRAFEIWWRRTFIRPYVEQQGNQLQSRKFHDFHVAQPISTNAILEED